MNLRTRILRGMVGVAVLAAVACGGDDGEGADDTAPSGDTGTETTEAQVDDTEPVHGGTLVYAVEADTTAPWTPQAMACAAACYSTVGRTVYEPLVLVGDDNEVYPYLLESLEPNEDYTVWTLGIRPNITFHDGEPLDADAVAYNLQATTQAALVGPAVQPIESVESDGDMTVTVTMDGPWRAFEFYISSQLGLMASPKWLQAVADGTASPSAPVGTGPFVYESYESGENGRFTATRNEDYWRGDGPNSTGEGLPYLDGIEVRFMPDSQARTQGLLAGDIDLLHTNNGSEIADLRENDDVNIETMEHPSEIEVTYLLINNSDEVAGAPNPFADIRVRRALAHATDNEVISEARYSGVFPPANGPFPPGRPGHVEDSGMPEFDPDAARALLEEVEAETGGPVSIALKTTTDPFNLTTSELLKSMWEEVGFVVTLDQIPQGEFINQALGGNFQVFTWRNHAGTDPDTQFIWWSSTTTQGIALNFGRIIDDEVDRLLEAIRRAPDDETSAELGEELSRYFGEQVFNVWNTWGFWGHAYGKNVHGVGTVVIPGAPEGVTGLIGGTINPTTVFKTS